MAKIRSLHVKATSSTSHTNCKPIRNLLKPLQCIVKLDAGVPKTSLVRGKKRNTFLDH